MTERMLRNANRLLLAIACLAAPLARAQAGTTKLPEFEVATVKPADPNGRVVGLFTYPGGRILCTQCPLQYLLMEAFNMQPYQITGGSGWLKDARFDVEAKPPVTSQSSKSNPASFKEHPNEEQRQMLQALLIDRFQLKFHREDREGPVYILEKNGKPLQATRAEGQRMPSLGRQSSTQGGAVPFGTGLAGKISRCNSLPCVSALPASGTSSTRSDRAARFL